MNDAPPLSPRHDRVLWLVSAAMVLAFGWFVSRGWHASILDVHEFRQLQTATSALWMKETGFKLAYETPLFGPPWSIPMEFPFYQAVVAGAAALFGTELEPTARGVSVAFLLLSLPAIALFARRAGLTRPQCWLVATCVVSAPLYLFYARTVMIETTALCTALWFLAALSRVGSGSRWLAWALLAAIAGTLAALAKVTTLLIACGPAAAIVLGHFRPTRTTGERTRWLIASGAAVAIALVVGYAWVRFADGVKLANPFAQALTSDALTAWNWGTWQQRGSAAFWTALGENLTRSVLSEVSLATVLIAAALAGRRALGWLLAGAAAFLSGPLLFANLFFRHDYYYCANAVFLLTGAGIVLALLWQNTRVPLAARGAVIVLFFAGQLLMYHRGYADFMRRDLPASPAVAEAIRIALPPEDVLVIFGWDWNSLVPYYAQRRAIMVPTERENDNDALKAVLAATSAQKVGALLVRPTGAWATDEFIAQRVAQLELAPVPVATSDEGRLFLRADLVEPAWSRLQSAGVGGVTLNLEAAAITGLATAASLPADIYSPAIFSPLPLSARSPFGANWGNREGHPVLNLHAPCEFIFARPPDATRLVAEFGIPEAAYEESEFTDGVGIQVIAIDAAGVELPIQQRLLRPTFEAADRGHLRLEIELPRSDRVAIRFTPGPAGQMNRDWIFCRSIRFE